MAKEKNVGCKVGDDIECFLELNDDYTESSSEINEDIVYENNNINHLQDSFYISYIFQAAPFIVDIFKHVVSNFIDLKKAKMQREAISHDKNEPESKISSNKISTLSDGNNVKENLLIKSIKTINASTDVYVGCIWTDNSYGTIDKIPIIVKLSERVAEKLSTYEKQKTKSKNCFQVILKGFMVKDANLFNYSKEPFTEVIDKSIFDGYIQNNEIPFNHENVCLFNDKQIVFNALKFYNTESKKWSNYIFKNEGQKLIEALERKIKI